jgi:nicotinamidase-related amidase/type 1 glutamine amidotransferase
MSRLLQVIGLSFLLQLPPAAIFAGESDTPAAASDSAASDSAASDSAGVWELRLRHQVERSPGEGRFHQVERVERWDPRKTVVIVCDMWDSHHCYRAVQREKEFAPRLNQLLMDARKRGATIIHAPSDCMKSYDDHPARKRAIEAPIANDYPEAISSWCHRIESEESGVYPIDQSDGGEDDTPEEHAKWEQALIAEGRNPRAPWLRQIDAIEIDSARDYITDQGKEVWNIIKDREIENVILAGVHTNMCVLGRPFGLRRMVSAGMNTILIRDMTDTMYNPQAKPYVSHFSGTDLIIQHIERHVCATVTSDQFIGGKPFRFADDKRRHVALVISEPEYRTEVTLPKFAESNLRRDHRLTMVFGSATEPDDLPGIEQIADADVLVLSVRRRTPPRKQLQVVRDFVSSGKPVVGIRTANHAFSLRKDLKIAGFESGEGASSWPTLDADLFGGNYSKHYGPEQKPLISIVPGQATHRVLHGIDTKPFVSGGSLYVVSPVDTRASVLLSGEIPGQKAEPVAWTFTREDGGRSFYTSLGAVDDFEIEAFVRLLDNAIRWSASDE